MISTKSLYTQILDLIESKGRRTTNTAIKSNKAAANTSQVASIVNTATTDDVLSAVTSLLGTIVESRIISGLEVTEASPLSNAVIVNPGSGTAGGKYYTLDTPFTVNVFFNDQINVYYINLYSTGIKAERKPSPNGLTVAKIINPNPDRFVVIKNDQDEDGNAYIQSFKKYNLYGYNDRFEEDTVELLRDNIGEILADNLIGNLRLSENLKITNASSSLEMDSNSIKMYSADGTVVAKFNNNGTYFYNDAGVEIAKFAVDGANIGNISIGTNSISSRNYVSESSGFKIDDSGYAEFSDVRVRGKISSSVFEYDKVSAVGGKLLVSNATVLSQVMLPTDNTITVDTAVFGIGDILYIKSGQDEEYLEVISVQDNVYTVSRDLASGYVAFPTWDKGIAVISTGKNDDTSGAVLGGYISLDSTSQYAPFIDILYRNSGVYNDVSTKVRLGNLAGINDSQFGQLSGFGLYADNAYIKGLIQASTICGSTISGSTISAGTVITSPLICGGDICGATIYGLVLEAGTLITSPTICGGDLYGTNISGSVITGACIQTGAGNPRTVFDAYSLKSFDLNGIETVKIQDGALQLTSALCCCNYTYLSSGTLRFHDEMGDAPYAKRLCSGIACTGDTIVLAGWKYAPNIQVSISQLQSYNSTCSGASQTWHVYYDTPVQYCICSSNYGYCFTVHACLTTSVSTGTTCLRDITFGTTYLTEANTCSVCIRHRFQLWCNAACANYFAGCLCYNVCYRINGSGTWCACSFTYLQPHANTSELKSTQDVYTSIALPSGQCWELTSAQTGLCWHDSGISSATIQCCLCSRDIASSSVMCGSGSTSSIALSYGCTDSDSYGTNFCCSAISVSGSIPANTYCSYGCIRGCIVCCMTTATSVSPNGGTATASANVLICAGAYTLLQTSTSAGASCTKTNCLSAYCCFTGEISGYTYLRVYGSTYARYLGTGAASASASSQGIAVCFVGGTQYHCYCIISGSAECCVYENIYTNQNTFNSSCTLDPAGCLNWIAFGYE